MDTVYNVTRVYLEMPHSYGGGEHGEDGEEDTGDGQGPGDRVHYVCAVYWTHRT